MQNQEQLTALIYDDMTVHDQVEFRYFADPTPPMAWLTLNGSSGSLTVDQCENCQQEGLAVASIARDAVVDMTPPHDDNGR